uniref:Uncharacterized protein n=1 Tax=Arundo donax TaxID=35708 RepID=A0A0A9CBL5_ARUDO
MSTCRRTACFGHILYPSSHDDSVCYHICYLETRIGWTPMLVWSMHHR